jgi:hypothetical protein
MKYNNDLIIPASCPGGICDADAFIAYINDLNMYKTPEALKTACGIPST